MERITNEPLLFPKLGCAGHLYAGEYSNGCLVIVAGEDGIVGKLSVNLVDLADELGENQFFVKLYLEGEVMNPPCLQSGLFKVVSEPFEVDWGTFQKWELIK